MEGEVGAQVAPPIFLNQPLPGRFREAAPLARKRDLPWQNTNFHNHHHHQQQSQQRFISSGYQQNPESNWNAKMWEWDRLGFAAKPSSDGILRLSTPSLVSDAEQNQKAGENSKVDHHHLGKKGQEEEEGEILTLKLGGGSYSMEEPVIRPNKRVRSGSPGSGGNYPMCQVDDCKADLTNSKDYHRRHKVCEIHGKTTKALVANQMQRFCQQCSRFHPLSEFDEGKRSCRRRLAGHNRRRRKTQPDDASSKLLLPASQENSGSGNLDIVNILTLLAGLQGQSTAKPNSSSSLPDRDRVYQILSKINSLPTTNTSPILPERGGFDLNVSQISETSSEHQSKMNGSTPPQSSTGLLDALSAALKVSAPNTLAAQSQGSSESSGDNKTKTDCLDLESAADANPQKRSTPAIPLIAVGRGSCTLQSLVEVSKHPVQEARSSLPLQLFSSTEDDSPPKMGSVGKYLSSESSNPMEERFPFPSAAEGSKHERLSICRDDSFAEANTSRGWISPLELFKDSEKRADNHSIQNIPYQPGYTSSSVSDHSPSSSNSDTQDRTGRIIFKLFDKDPSNFPGTLRTQILTWLSHSPSEMESYIRPGCVVLSVYVSMASFAWDELEENLLQRVSLLVQSSDLDFWRNMRFLVHTDRQLASHKDGKIRLCKSWRTWSAPELISVSPLAVVSGKKTSLVLRGRNLTVPGTKIHCTCMGGYTSKEVLGSAYPGTIYDDSSLESFDFPGGSPNVIGRCFIEVENGFKGNSFPVIIADDKVCQELRALEPEFEEARPADMMQADQLPDYVQPRSKEDALHFLNELGWLFQRKSTPPSLFDKDFSSTRFKFLFMFSVERDWSALVKTLLDILVAQNCGKDGLVGERLETLSEIQLLNRAVKRKCRKMVDLLLHYTISNGNDGTKIYIFPPNLVGPGGLTPLHLAASMQGSQDMVDALTNDPQEIGLNCWSSMVDDNGQSPYAYALMRNYHSYNSLVARKLSDRRNSQVSIPIDNEEITSDKSRLAREQEKSDIRPLQVASCSRCALMETRRIKSTLRTQGLLRRPYINPLLAIAAVCVCVCVFMRGAPELGSVSPFKWENLDFGPR